MELISDNRKTFTNRSRRILVMIGVSIFIILGTAIAADLLGLPGTKVVNLVLAGGEEGKPPCIIFNPHQGYRFPIIPRIWNRLFPPSASPSLSDSDSVQSTHAGIKRFLKGDEKVLNGFDSDGRFESGR
jgi:hypothetical protein